MHQFGRTRAGPELLVQDGTERGADQQVVVAAGDQRRRRPATPTRPSGCARPGPAEPRTGSAPPRTRTGGSPPARHRHSRVAPGLDGAEEGPAQVRLCPWAKRRPGSRGRAVPSARKEASPAPMPVASTTTQTARQWPARATDPVVQRRVPDAQPELAVDDAVDGQVARARRSTSTTVSAVASRRGLLEHHAVDCTVPPLSSSPATSSSRA